MEASSGEKQIAEQACSTSAHGAFWTGSSTLPRLHHSQYPMRPSQPVWEGRGVVGLNTRNSTTAPAMVHLQDAVSNALQSGATWDEILIVLQLKASEFETPSQDHMPGFPKDDPGTIYDAVPPGLIDLPSARRKYNVPRRTIHSWVEKGHVRLRGRLKGPAKGGGYLLVREDELTAYLTAPRKKGGRPSIK